MREIIKIFGGLLTSLKDWTSSVIALIGFIRQFKQEPKRSESQASMIKVSGDLDNANIEHNECTGFLLNVGGSITNTEINRNKAMVDKISSLQGR